MSGTKNLHLTDLIDLDTLRNIQDKLAKVVDIPVITVDANGAPVGNQSNFTPFCLLIRSTTKGSEQCISCDAQAGQLATLERKPRIYDCHMGLKDCVAPIIINEQYFGSVLGGQVLIKGDKSKDTIDTKKIAEEFDLQVDELENVIEKIPIVSQEYLENCIDFYNFLANHFAQMGMHRFTQERLLHEIQAKHVLEQKAKSMELKTITAQINPHFLFNTLNSIARMALIEDAPETEELIYNLSDLLRYSLKNIEEFPVIREEINNVKRYLFIQTLRYSDRITYEIDIEENVLGYRIPSMVLQPIVENAIVHGLEAKKDGGTVIIHGRKVSENEIVIEVKDNGVGIQSDLLKTLNEMDENDIGKIGIGLLNTNERIKHYYGMDYGLHIKSVPNVETIVSITLPCMKDSQRAI